jgi:hypothetical protein
MKYMSVPTIAKALHRVNEGNTQEHRTGTPALGLVRHYFPEERFAITAEQIQISNKRPDLSVELLTDDGKFVPHTFVEMKSLVNKNFDDMLDQLSDTILETVDLGETDYCVYVLAMKGTRIAILEYHSYASLLDEYNILNYKGFVPATYRMSAESYFDINQAQGISNLIKFLHYKLEFTPSKSELEALGLKSSPKLPYPYILDLLNKDHENYVHDLFKKMATRKPGTDII